MTGYVVELNTSSSRGSRDIGPFDSDIVEPELTLSIVKGQLPNDHEQCGLTYTGEDAPFPDVMSAYSDILFGTEKYRESAPFESLEYGVAVISLNEDNEEVVVDARVFNHANAGKVIHVLEQFYDDQLDEFHIEVSLV